MRARLKKWLAAEGDEGRARRRRKTVKWSAAVVVSLFIFFVAIPAGIKWSIEYWLHEKGHIEADIGGLWFNLFSGRLSLSGVEAGKSGVERLDFTVADANMGWLQLLGKKLLIDKVELRDATFDIRHEEDGTIIAGGIEIKPTGAEPEKPIDPEEEEGEPWGVGTGPIDLANVRFLYYAPEISADLLIHSLHIDPMSSWEPDTPSNVTLDIELNGERATFIGVVLPFAVVPQVEGQFKLNRFSLAWIAAALVEAGITSLEGDIHIEGFVTLKLTEEGEGREASFAGKVGLDNFALEQEGLKASLDSLLVDGTVSDLLKENDGSDDFSGAITLSGLSLEAEAGQARLGGFSLVGDSGFNLDRAGKITVTHKGDLVLKEVSGGSDGSMATVGLTELKTDTAFSLDSEGRGEASYEGTVWIERASAAEGGQKPIAGMPGTASVDLQTLAGTVDATFSAAGADFSLLLDSLISIETKGARLPQGTLDYTKVDWSGKVEVEVSDQMQTVKTSGELGVTDFLATVIAPAVKVEHKTLVWKGDGGYTSAGEEFTPTAKGGVKLNGFQVRRSKDNGVLVDLKKLALSGFEVEGLDEIGFARMTLDSFKGLARPKAKKADKKKKAKAKKAPLDHVAQLKALKVEGVKIKELSRIETKLVSVNSLALWIERNKEGTFELVELLPEFGDTEGAPDKSAAQDSSVEETAPDKSAAQDSSVEETAAGQSAALTVAVDKFELKGDNSVVFSDPSLSPAYKTELTEILFSLKGLDSADPARSTYVTFSAVADKYGTIEAEGRGLPFAELPTGSASVKLEGVNLAPLTSYSNRYIGYRLVSGLMDFSAAADVNAGEVVATMHTHINKLEMETLHPDEQDEFTQELGVPVNLALALLTDKNDDIDLGIPVEGSLNDPDFGIGDIVGQLAKKATVAAIKVAAVSYFAPLGAIFAVGKVIDLATALNIDPVLFEAGLYEIDPKGLEHMGTMVDLFNNRPAIRLQLCGVAAYPDRDLFARELMQDKLEELNTVGVQMAKTSPKELVAAMTPPPSPLVSVVTALPAGADGAAAQKDATNSTATAVAEQPPVVQALQDAAQTKAAPEDAAPKEAVPPTSASAAATEPSANAATPPAAAVPVQPAKPDWIVGVQVFGPPLPTEVPNELLYELAGGRTDSVRDYLAGQSLDPKRLLPCSPEIAHDEDVLPQTRVSIDSL